MRVTKTNRCPVCNSPRWCLLLKDAVICMRTPNNRPHQFKGGEVGYIHPYGSQSKPVKIKEEPAPPSINVKALLKDWSQWPRSHSVLAHELGVSIDSLNQLECVKAPWHHAWGFPMMDGYGNYIGIRIRNLSGQKWAQPGSHAGIFNPHSGIRVPRRVLVVEGPTDSAAAIDMGFYPIGRPSCSGGVTHIVAFIRRHHVAEAVIVSDNDDPGIRGAKDLQRWLEIPSCVLVLPTKDLREFSKLGDHAFLKSTIDAMVQQLVWTQPRKAA